MSLTLITSSQPRLLTLSVCDYCPTSQIHVTTPLGNYVTTTPFRLKRLRVTTHPHSNPHLIQLYDYTQCPVTKR